MAIYDNKHWLLSHIWNSFISSDDSGICELVMHGEKNSQKLGTLTSLDRYPGGDEGDEDDADDELHSYDALSVMGCAVIHPRTSTTEHLEKMNRDHKIAAKAEHVKWELNPTMLTEKEREALFKRKEFRPLNKVDENRKIYSLLAEQLDKSPPAPRNPFLEFAKFDGNAQVDIPCRRYGIFMTMLPEAERNYPLNVKVLNSARVRDLIGLICWKYILEHGENFLGDDVECYSLYIAEDDGEVDWDFPCLDSRETIGKFNFAYLALVKESGPVIHKYEDCQREDMNMSPHINTGQEQEMEELIKGHISALEAPLYQSFRVFVINKVRVKTEIQLGISGEKFEIDPVIQQGVSAKFWNRQKPVSYSMECVAACDLTDTKANGQSTFRLVYDSTCCSTSAEQGSYLHDHSITASYKHHDFEAEHKTAEKIVQKINYILELSSSFRRREYIALREKKSHQKHSFHIGPR